MSEPILQFRRLEKKYLTTAVQAERFLALIAPYIRPDEYGETAVFSCYYDTPEHLLIRRSLEKPFYKEKLRLRCYGIPSEEKTVFIELKKKYDGVVYKRRVDLPYRRAMYLLEQKEDPPDLTQVEKEIRWMFRLYPRLAPSMLLRYNRQAFYAKQDPTIRLTVDSDIRYSAEQPLLLPCPEGEPLLSPDARLLELKISSAIPLWLSNALNEAEIYPTSFSKYGKAFLQKQVSHGGIIHA